MRKRLLVVAKALIMAVSLIVNFAPAQEEGSVPPMYYQHHAIGWSWYQTEAPQKAKTTLKKFNVQNAMAAIARIRDPIARVHAIQHLLEETKDTAALSPTTAHIATYLQLQNAVSSQATALRQHWQAVLLDDPQLDYNVGHPTSEWANLAAVQSKDTADGAAIRQFASSYGLFFFYRGTCPHCQHFAPILQAFAKHYGFQIVPVTMDGISLPEFPNSVADSGQAERLNVQEVPSLFAVDPTTRQVIALGAGDRAYDELRQDILTAMKAAHMDGKGEESAN